MTEKIKFKAANPPKIMKYKHYAQGALFVASGAYEKRKYGKVFHVQFVISRRQHFLQFRKPHVSSSGLELVRMAALGNLRQRSEIDFYF